MVTPKGWDGIKPYYWCDNEHNHAVVDHLWFNLVHHPENGIFIKGLRKSSPNSIEINNISGSNIVNINIKMDDPELRIETVDSIRIIMEDAYINGKHYSLVSEEHFKQQNTFNLQYIWQPQDKK